MPTTMTNLTVACVLRTGPDFRPEHVLALHNGVRRNLSIPYRFVCLTDQVAEVSKLGIEARPLPHRWPGWWAKLNLFAPGMFAGPVLYFDLDSMVIGKLDDIAARDKVLETLQHVRHPTTLDAPAHLMRAYRSPARHLRRL